MDGQIPIIRSGDGKKEEMKVTVSFVLGERSNWAKLFQPTSNVVAAAADPNPSSSSHAQPVGKKGPPAPWHDSIQDVPW